jgi:hypothetical protein
MVSIKLPKLFYGIVSARLNKEWLNADKIEQFEVKTNLGDEIIIYSNESETELETELYKGKLETINVNDFVYPFYRITQIYVNGKWLPISEFIDKNFTDKNFTDTWEFEVESVLSILSENKIDMVDLDLDKQTDILDKLTLNKTNTNQKKVEQTIKFLHGLLGKLVHDDILYKEITEFIKFLED